MREIRSVPELYASALAIEREAAERYAEFAQRMGDLGNDAVAEVFSSLAGFEAEHLDELERRTRGVDLPPPPAGGWRWLESGGPETAARELVFRVLTPRQALEIALAAEKRAQAFFEGALMLAGDPGVEALAREMAAEEQEHVAMVERLLEHTPAPVDWAALFEAARADRQL
ncbi:MAG: ferritin-like domain-containing protein [Clostridia bacterium]